MILSTVCNRVDLLRLISRFICPARITLCMSKPNTPQKDDMGYA
jgi:hypothetical protein